MMSLSSWCYLLVSSDFDNPVPECIWGVHEEDAVNTDFWHKFCFNAFSSH